MFIKEALNDTNPKQYINYTTKTTEIKKNNIKVTLNYTTDPQFNKITLYIQSKHYE